MNDLTDHELLFIIKSTSITCDALAQKLERLRNPSRQYAETIADLELGRELRAKLDREHSSRIGLVVRP